MRAYRLSVGLGTVLAMLEVTSAHARTTFGVSFKETAPDGGSWATGEEVVVFTRECSTKEVPCVMDYFWAGGSWPGYFDSELLYYVDGEVNP